MRNVLLASLVSLSSLLAACSCGAYAGGGDTVYQRGADMLILCENGGFVANVASGSIEGKYMANPAGSTAVGFGVRGDDGQLAFDLYDNADGTASTPQLGDAPWQEIQLDKTSLNHADLLCQELPNRSWWTAQ